MSHDHAHEKENVALMSLLASFVLAAAKLIAGLSTGSLGILSEAIHAVLDFGATVITWFAVRWSEEPPDDEHHYGHAKIESVAALIETGLLFVTTAWIVWESIRRLLFHEGHVEVTWWSAAIIAMSIIIDFNRARALQKVADKHSSEALEADALHFSSDMWSSAVVLLGLGAVWLGVPAADSIAALLVSFFIGLAGWRLGQRTIATLMDRAPEGATEAVRKIVEQEPGVLAMRRLRIRPSGATMFVSTVLEVPRTMPVDDMVRLKDSITTRIEDIYPKADVTVTANPVALSSETVFQKVMLIATRQGLAIHHLTVQHLDDRLSVSFDLEVDGAMALSAAHATATNLEASIRRELGPHVEVETHIEPQPERMLEGHAVEGEQLQQVSDNLRKFAAKQKRLSDVHNIRVRQTDEGMFVHYHCRFAGADTVDAVHTAVDHVENALQNAYPAIRRVIAHAEPVGQPLHDL
jgi:cation diffusion facilitator family transporter